MLISVKTILLILNENKIHRFIQYVSKKCGTFLLIDSIASSGHRFAIAVKLMRIFRIQNGDLGFFANVDL